MKLFNLFARKKKTIKELYEPVLDKMWCCLIRFRPWEPERHKVIIQRVNITEAYATADGIFVKSDFQDPFCIYSEENIDGYIDKIVARRYFSGFFETEEEAKLAYNKLMEDWISVIRKNMVETKERKETHD